MCLEKLDCQSAMGKDEDAESQDYNDDQTHEPLSPSLRYFWITLFFVVIVSCVFLYKLVTVMYCVASTRETIKVSEIWADWFLDLIGYTAHVSPSAWKDVIAKVHFCIGRK